MCSLQGEENGFHLQIDCRYVVSPAMNLLYIFCLNYCVF
jgi:hypothetical protein